MPFLQLKIDEEGMREVRKKDGIREEEIASKGVRNRHIQAVSNRWRVVFDSTKKVYGCKLNCYTMDKLLCQLFQCLRLRSVIGGRLYGIVTCNFINKWKQIKKK